MKLRIRETTVAPMAQWLKQAKDTGIREEQALRQILAQEDYQVEFARYGDPGLPVCGIHFEEAVDFFLNFDRKDFENPRLAYKQASFLDFYQDLDNRLEKLALLRSITPEDMERVVFLLRSAVPQSVFDSLEELTILLTISIGNSMGWPYQNYIHFDVANLDFFEDKETFLHVLAHEIHHILFSQMMPEEMTPRQYFFLNFAFEGLAMHFCNNADAVGKRAKYPGPAYGVDVDDWQFFAEQHEDLMKKVFSDAEKTASMSMEQVAELLSEYEQFSFTSLKTGETRQVSQYPTYYIGCYLWGTVDLVLGSQRLFAALQEENGFDRAWAEVCRRV